MLIADSGSTKTAWMWVEEGMSDRVCQTSGINPILQTKEEITAVVEEELLPAFRERGKDIASVDKVFFYGAGCLPSHCLVVEAILQWCFPEAMIQVHSDLLGAARALCIREEGIACILGTGSNSCLFDGEQIVKNVSPLGFILGDEGSGAVLGRSLVGDLLKGCLPSALKEEFLCTYHLTPEEIIAGVYRRPMPSRFLASFAPFLNTHRTHPGVHRLLVDNFRSFFQRNVAAYERHDLPVHFVGSIASVFSNELREAARQESFVLGHIERSPLRRMAEYHRVHSSAC